MWPVIVRELRAESRRPFTYWLRVIGACALLVAFGLTMFSLGSLAALSGPAFGGAGAFALPYRFLGATLFGNLNAALFAAVWLLVPLLTADCLSREKREGT